jgi:hypothetical protein
VKSPSNDQALFSNATMMAASLFGQSVNASTCSTTIPHFSVPTGNTIQLPASPQKERNLHAGLGIRGNKEVFAIWEPQSSRFAVVRGSERAHSEMMM